MSFAGAAHRLCRLPPMAELEPDIDIRPVTRAEAEAWRALRLEMLKDNPTAFKSSYEEEAPQNLSSFAARIPEDPIDVLFGVYRGGVLSGSAGFSREKRVKIAHKGLMWSVYLKPELRGRGVGEALVQRVIDHAGANVSVLLCSVTSENTAACELYRRMGFVEYGIEPRALRVDGRDYDEDMLILNLD
jgi:ribosomal protein S18 acetylase RimI-like enzyme